MNDLSLFTIPNNSNATFTSEKLYRKQGGFSDQFIRVMQGVAEDSIKQLKYKLGPSINSCDLFTWNFSTWNFNDKVRHTPRSVRFNSNQVIDNYYNEYIVELIKDLVAVEGFDWSLVKKSIFFKRFMRFLFIRWTKLLLAIVFTFCMIYLLTLKFPISIQGD
jgi:hypothetical protein